MPDLEELMETISLVQALYMFLGRRYMIHWSMQKKNRASLGYSHGGKSKNARLKPFPGPEAAQMGFDNHEKHNVLKLISQNNFHMIESLCYEARLERTDRISSKTGFCKTWGNRPESVSQQKNNFNTKLIQIQKWF
jgi:hypothetical protein